VSSANHDYQTNSDGFLMDQDAFARPESRSMDTAVTLRPFGLADVDAMTAWASDPVVTAFMTWDAYTSREHQLAILRDTVLPHPWFRAICLGGHAPVGAVSVTPTDDRCRAEVGIVLARAHWGKGVATAALKRAVTTVFGDLEGVERVEALVDVDNAASQRVFEKAGFRREAVLRSYRVVKGRLQDMVIYSFIWFIKIHETYSEDSRLIIMASAICLFDDMSA
jgi:RimJ/RimL family protein N-acetyltransferase